MRLAWVTGRITLSRRVDALKPGALLICEAIEPAALNDEPLRPRRRAAPMSQSLIVFDHHGAAVGDVIAVSEGGEATNPFRPARVPIDAYCAARIDTIDIPKPSPTVASAK